MLYASLLFCDKIGYNELDKGNCMARENFKSSTNPYHYALHCIGGKWKMTILHEIYTFGKIRFNQTLKVLPISEKVLSQQLKELLEDGLVQRIVDDSTFPPTIDYMLTATGEELIPALDIFYIWSIRQMKERGIEIDTDSYTVHTDAKYMDALKDVLGADFLPPTDAAPKRRQRAGR